MAIGQQNVSLKYNIPLIIQTTELLPWQEATTCRNDDHFAREIAPVHHITIVFPHAGT